MTDKLTREAVESIILDAIADSIDNEHYDCELAERVASTYTDRIMALAQPQNRVMVPCNGGCGKMVSVDTSRAFCVVCQTPF